MTVGSTWIPITKRLPDASTPVLIASDDWVPHAVFHLAGHGDYKYFDRHDSDVEGNVPFFLVTHWMPIPKAPHIEDTKET